MKIKLKEKIIKMKNIKKKRIKNRNKINDISRKRIFKKKK